MGTLRTAATAIIVACCVTFCAPIAFSPAGYAIVGLMATVPEGAPEEDQPGWDCATMGNRVCGTGVRPENVACWAEKVHGTIEDVEIICGDKGDRPRTDTADIGDTVWVAADPLDGGYEPWVVTITGLEPDSTN